MRLAMFRDSFGNYVPTDWEERAAEFNAFVPDWQERLAEFDARESGMTFTESDLEIGVPDYMQQIRDWDSFLSIISEWE